MKKTATIILTILLVISMTACSMISEKEKGLVRGKWEKDVYTNTFANFTYTLPEGWEYASDEDILELMDLSTDLIDDDKKLEAELGQLNTVYDMMIQDKETGSNIIIMFENLALSVGGTELDERDYAELVAEQLNSLEDVDYTGGEISEVKVAAETYVKVPLTFTYSDVSMEQAYYVRKIDKYMVVIAVTVGVAEEGITADDLIEHFSKLD